MIKLGFIIKVRVYFGGFLRFFVYGLRRMICLRFLGDFRLVSFYNIIYVINVLRIFWNLI